MDCRKLLKSGGSANRILGQGQFSSGIRFDPKRMNTSGKYCIPAYALHPQHVTGEFAWPREWIDFAATVAPTTTSPASKPPPPKVNLPDISTLEIDTQSNGLGVAVSSDSLIDYVAFRPQNGQWQYVLDKDGMPIEFGLLSEGKIPSWLLPSGHGLPSNCIATKDALTDMQIGLARKNQHLRTQDDANIAALRRYNITCDDRTGQLTISGVKLMAQNGNPMMIRQLRKGKIPWSILDHGSKERLKESLAGRTQAQLENEVARAQTQVDAATAALEKFNEDTRILPETVANFKATLDDALGQAGMDVAHSSVSAIQRKSQVITAVNTYLAACLKRPDRENIGTAKGPLKQVLRGQGISDTEIDKIIKPIDGYRLALTNANQTEIPDPDNIAQNIAKAKEKLEGSLTEKRQILQELNTELTNLKAGRTRYHEIVDENV
ncbi:MAG: hypothetical protein LBB26_00190 [Puniceicoccales bacterium]|nr:hypothetical protein [Puniceicoccales bacterium]